MSVTRYKGWMVWAETPHHPCLHYAGWWAHRPPPQGPYTNTACVQYLPPGSSHTNISSYCMSLYHFVHYLLTDTTKGRLSMLTCFRRSGYWARGRVPSVPFIASVCCEYRRDSHHVGESRQSLAGLLLTPPHAQISYMSPPSMWRARSMHTRRA